jgi:uncharacterized protein (TIGR00288 family)
MELFQTKNIALYIDFENIHSEEFDIEVLVEKLKERGRLIIKRAYADWGRFAKIKQTMLFSSVELIEMPASGHRGKNSSDIKMTIDALETAFNRPYIDTFVVVSGDSDFTPLISKLRELDRYVIVVCSKENTSKLLKGYCDELIYLSSVGSKVAEKVSLKSGYQLLRRAIESLENLRGEARSSLVKSQMVRLDATFSEENFGFKPFRKFLEQAQRDGVITLEKLKDGENRVTLPGSNKTSNGTPAEKEIKEVKIAAEVKEAVVEETAELLPVSEEKLAHLISLVLAGVVLARNGDDKPADLNELASCCKRLGTPTPAELGLSKAKGFKGLVQLVQDHGYLELTYEASRNMHLIRLTAKGERYLLESPRPDRFTEVRYYSVLNNALFRARLYNEKQVHDAVVKFLLEREADQAPSFQEFLTWSREALSKIPPSTVPKILKALQANGALTVMPHNASRAWVEAVIESVQPWETVLVEILRWQVALLATKLGEPIQRELFTKLLMEENGNNNLAEDLPGFLATMEY